MSTRFTQAAEVEFEAVDDAGVLLDMASGKYFRLNETGAEVWRLLSTSRDLEGIVAKLAAARGLRPDDIRNDINSLLAEMVELGVVVAEG